MNNHSWTYVLLGVGVYLLHRRSKGIADTSYDLPTPAPTSPPLPVSPPSRKKVAKTTFWRKAMDLPRFPSAVEKPELPEVTIKSQFNFPVMAIPHVELKRPSVDALLAAKTQYEIMKLDTPVTSSYKPSQAVEAMATRGALTKARDSHSAEYLYAKDGIDRMSRCQNENFTRMHEQFGNDAKKLKQLQETITLLELRSERLDGMTESEIRQYEQAMIDSDKTKARLFEYKKRKEELEKAHDRWFSSATQEISPSSEPVGDLHAKYDAMKKSLSKFNEWPYATAGQKRYFEAFERGEQVRAALPQTLIGTGGLIKIRGGRHTLKPGELPSFWW